MTWYLGTFFDETVDDAIRYRRANNRAAAGIADWDAAKAITSTNDGFDDDDPTVNLEDADGDGYNSCEGDCDDADVDSNPGSAEICEDGIDNDCDGLADENDSDCQEAPPEEFEFGEIGGGCDCVASHTGRSAGVPTAALLALLGLTIGLRRRR